MIDAHKPLQNDITPWQSIEPDNYPTNPIINIHNLNPFTPQPQPSHYPYFNPNLHKHITKTRSNNKNHTKNISINIVCNFQIPKRQGKVRKERIIAHRTFKQSRYKTEQIEFNRIREIKETGFFPNSEIKLEQFFPSYSLKRINRNTTFYRQATGKVIQAGGKQMQSRGKPIQIGGKYLQSESMHTQQRQPQEIELSLYQKQLNITNSNITLKSHKPKCKNANQTVRAQLQHKQCYRISNNDKIILKNEQNCFKLLDASKSKKGMRLTGLNHKYLHLDDEGRQRLSVSRSCVERGRLLDQLIEQIRLKQASNLKKERLFLKAVDVELKKNKCLQLPKIELVEIKKKRQAE